MTATQAPTRFASLRRAAADFWLRCFFWFTRRAPRLLESARPVICAVVWLCSPAIRRGTRANASHLLGPNSTPAQQTRLSWRTLNNFYLFCCDVGRSRGLCQQELLARVETIEGQEIYRRARAGRKGMIVVTAHAGSFEVAMAALRQVEEHIHVLFRRDAIDHFERQRSELRRRLGVHEAVVDDGWTVWIALRQALRDDQVVVIQADRVLPGQKGQLVRILDGEMELPAGPIKLAILTGAPIVPIFSLRTPSGRIRLSIQEPINIAAQPAADDALGAAMDRLARVLEKFIAAHPEQWLMLQPAWRRDA
jgi:phosphatidylinositol dimannoside acyltransferase